MVDNNSLVDITDLDRDVLLQHLWENSSQAPFYGNGPVPSWDLELVKKQLRDDGYADYVCGRCIKCNVYKDDHVDPWLYDRDAGADTFRRVVEEMRTSS